MATSTTKSGATDARVEELHEAARRRTGLDDFGAPSYLVGLRKLLDDLGPLSGTRWLAVKNELVQGLVCRLRTEAGWKQYPAYKQVRIKRPLVICGVPRTGTTVLHKLLSIDPQFQGLEHWLCEWPKPRPPRDMWMSDPGYQEAKKRMEARDEASPIFKMAHDIAVSEVDECVEVLCQEFVSNRYGCIFDVPEYEQWFRREDQGPSYRRFADVLRLIGLNSDKKWLLKNPGHIGDLDALLDVFPDACVVVTTRDPVKSMPSLANIVVSLRQGYLAEEDIDPRQAGSRELDFWSLAHRKSLPIRKQHADQFIDIDHLQFHQDPIGSVKKIYARFDLVLDDETEKRMREWIAQNPAGKLGEHVYALETFGLSRESVEAAFNSGK